MPDEIEEAEMALTKLSEISRYGKIDCFLEEVSKGTGHSRSLMMGGGSLTLLLEI